MPGSSNENIPREHFNAGVFNLCLNIPEENTIESCSDAFSEYWNESIPAVYYSSDEENEHDSGDSFPYKDAPEFIPIPLVTRPSKRGPSRKKRDFRQEEILRFICDIGTETPRYSYTPRKPHTPTPFMITDEDGIDSGYDADTEENTRSTDSIDVRKSNRNKGQWQERIQDQQAQNKGKSVNGRGQA